MSSIILGRTFSRLVKPEVKSLIHRGFLDSSSPSMAFGYGRNSNHLFRVERSFSFLRAKQDAQVGPSTSNHNKKPIEVPFKLELSEFRLKAIGVSFNGEKFDIKADVMTKVEDVGEACGKIHFEFTKDGLERLTIS